MASMLARCVKQQQVKKQQLQPYRHHDGVVQWGACPLPNQVRLMCRQQTALIASLPNWLEAEHGQWAHALAATTFASA
jgi:hypothetical protein